MPRNVLIEEADLIALQEGGGLARKTETVRAKHYKEFFEYVKGMTGDDLETLLGEGGGEEEHQRIVKLLGTYFFTMRVIVNGEEIWPKKAYAEKIRSNIKMSILHKFKVDITDPGQFPESAKNWKSFCEKLAKEGRSETEHHPEVDPVTMEAINSLGMDVMAALEARGTDEYDEKLSKVPPELHNKLNSVLQWIAMMQLVLFECRRGGENIDQLRKKDFKEFEDAVKKFKYIKHDSTEKDKNHQQGTNSSVYGCIPFLDFADNFNPGKIFSFYLKCLPDESTKEGVEGGFLFPKPRQQSKKFDMHNSDQICLYEPNMKGLLQTFKHTFNDDFILVGKNSIYAMLPSLTDAVGRPRQTNHCIR